MSPTPRTRRKPAPAQAASAPPEAGRSEGEALPRSGDVLEVTREASVQFATPMLFRVIRVHDWPTYTGWIWLDGYQLNASGDAVERRSIFVQAGGLRRVPAPTSPTPRPMGGRRRPSGPVPPGPP